MHQPFFSGSLFFTLKSASTRPTLCQQPTPSLIPRFPCNISICCPFFVPLFFRSSSNHRSSQHPSYSSPISFATRTEPNLFSSLIVDNYYPTTAIIVHTHSYFSCMQIHFCLSLHAAQHIYEEVPAKPDMIQLVHPTRSLRVFPFFFLSATPFFRTRLFLPLVVELSVPTSLYVRVL
jgi:hypothetical protein